MASLVERWRRVAALALLVFSIVASPASAHVAGAGSARATYDFNPGWRLLVGDPAGAERADFDDATWKPVTLPRAWNEDAAFKLSIEKLPTGVAWYTGVRIGRRR